MLPQGPNMHAFLFQMTMKEPSHTTSPCLVYNEETQQCILRWGEVTFLSYHHFYNSFCLDC